MNWDEVVMIAVVVNEAGSYIRLYVNRLAV